MSERASIFGPGRHDPGITTAPCYQCGKPMPVKSTPEMCPSCHHLNFPKTVGMKPTYEELEAGLRDYLDARTVLGSAMALVDTHEMPNADLVTIVEGLQAATDTLLDLAERLGPRKTEEAN